MAFVTAEPPADASGPGRRRPAAGPLRVGQDVLDRLEKSAIAAYREGRVTVRRKRAAGCFLYGPYWQLPAGRYRLRFRGAARRPRLPDEPVLGVEVLALGRFQQAWQDFTIRELEAGTGSLEFVVPPELGLESGDEARFEFRFFHLGNADLALAAVVLEEFRGPKTELRGPEMPPPGRRWRLFGRLRGRALGFARRGRARVRRWQRPGVVLAAGRPRLPLPAGPYRLCVRGSAERARRPGEPVLAVAVVAKSRWRGRPRWRVLPGGRDAPEFPLAWRAFTAAELAQGAAETDFTVPPELGLEAGEEMPFDFRFVHLGNADLAIDAVELRRLDPAEKPDGTAGEGQSSGRLAKAPRPAVLAAPAVAGPARRKVVVVGNCQAQTVHEALLRAGHLNARMEARYHFVELQKNLHEEGRRELAACDVLLVQEIRDWERYPLREAIPDRVPIITFPLLHFASLWPFDHYNGPGDREAHEREWPNLTFAYLDGLLGRLRREIPDPEQRFAAYRALAVPGIVNCARLHDFEERRLLAMDRKYDFGIGRFILDNFRRRRLFHTTNHPNGQILALLMRYLMRRLALDGSYRPRPGLDQLRRLQVPVHPKVARALGVAWAHERTRYSYAGRMITWEEYIRSYIDHYG
jgi:hypothetical protein